MVTKKTNPTADEFDFARLFWQHGSARQAGLEKWPDVKSAGAKGKRWAERPAVKVAIEAVREMMQDQMRAEFIANGCGMNRIIELTTERLENPETAAREFRELAIWAADLMGYTSKKASKEPRSGNALADLTGAAAYGAAIGAGVSGGRLSPVRPPLPQDTGQAGQTGSVHTVAPSGTVLARPSTPDQGRPS